MRLKRLSAVALHNTIVAPYVFYYGSEEQKARWLPRMASGAYVGAIAMTEPGTGSDLQAVRTVARKAGNHYVLSGQKTFISNGQSADLIVVVAKTDPALGAKEISLIVVETAEAEGFRARAISTSSIRDAGHLRALLRRRARADRQSARARRATGVRAAHAAIAAGTAHHRCRRRGDDGARARRDDSPREATAQGLRPAPDRLPEHAVQARRVQDRSRDCAGVRRPTRWSASRRQARRGSSLDGASIG